MKSLSFLVMRIYRRMDLGIIRLDLLLVILRLIKLSWGLDGGMKMGVIKH